MEQLTQKEVKELIASANTQLEKAGVGQTPASAEESWVRNWISPLKMCPDAGSRDAECADAGCGCRSRRQAAEEAIASAPMWSSMPIIERRTVRRAEAIWAQLAAHQHLPDPVKVDELLRNRMGRRSMLLQTPHDAPAQIVCVGDRLSVLTGLVSGVVPDIIGQSTALGAELIALAEKAILAAAPCQFESGADAAHDIDNSRSDNRANNLQLLMRAVALPFARPGRPDKAGSAVVVTSWRKLLSREETRALHRELRAAMHWIHDQVGRS